MSGGLVLVDGHPICDRCGSAVGPTSTGWRHVGPRVRFPPVTEPRLTWERLRTLSSYRDVVARFPSVVGGPQPITEEDWNDGFERLIRYHRMLGTLSRPHALGPADNPYQELVTVLLGRPIRPPTPGVARMLDLPRLRRELAARFAWAIPSESSLAAIAELGPLIDGGAGTGYWAAMLAARGADVLAVDRAPPGGQLANQHHTGARPWMDVHRSETAAAVRAHPGRALMLCWPPFDDDGAGYRPLLEFRGSWLAYIGEPEGGATGTPRFARELELNWTPETTIAVPAWPGIKDRLTIYRRNPVRRRHLTRNRCDECGRFVPTGAIGRCSWCRSRHPAALTLRYGPHLLEYPAEVLAGMPNALVAALEKSPRRVSDG